MQNYLILAITLLTFVPIVIGVLLGLLRGSRRALTRLILVLLCIVVAFVLCGTLTDTVTEVDISVYMNGEVEGPMTLVDYVTATLGENMEGAAEMIVPLAQILIKIVLFLMLFLLLLFFTWIIIFPILQIFIKPRKIKNDQGKVLKKKKHPLLGAAFGLLEGVAVALVLCIVLNGVLANVGRIVAISDGLAEISQQMNSGEPSTQAEEGEEGGGDIADPDVPQGGMDLSGLKALLDEYNESMLGKLYNGIGKAPFNWLAKVKTADGETVTLNGQLEALNGIVDIAKEFLQMQNVDFTNFYGTGAEGEETPLAKLTTILTNVENIKKGLSEEANKTVGKLLNMLGAQFGMEDVTKYYNLNFAKEASAFNKLSEYKDTNFSEMTQDEVKAAAKDIVSALADSELIMDTLAEMELDFGSGLDKEQREEVDKALDELIADNTLTAEQVNRLRDIFGLNNTNNGD